MNPSTLTGEARVFSYSKEDAGAASGRASVARESVVLPFEAVSSMLAPPLCRPNYSLDYLIQLNFSF